MGMFDTVNVEEILIINENLPPLLPLKYQTKDLDRRLKVYTLEDIFRDFSLKEIRLYTIFDEKFLSELLEDEDFEKIILFSMNDFSKCAANRWLEYNLTISRKKIVDIKLISFHR